MRKTHPACPKSDGLLVFCAAPKREQAPAIQDANATSRAPEQAKALDCDNTATATGRVVYFWVEKRFAGLETPAHDTHERFPRVVFPEFLHNPQRHFGRARCPHRAARWARDRRPYHLVATLPRSAVFGCYCLQFIQSIFQPRPNCAPRTPPGDAPTT